MGTGTLLVSKKRRVNERKQEEKRDQDCPRPQK